LKNIQKKKNNVLTQKQLFGLKVMDNTLTNIKLENPLSTAQNTIIAFQKQHPNLNLTP
jgi:hypothetical protein